MMKSATQRTVIILIIFTLAMFGFGYALVPLYNVFCKVVGINGKGTLNVQQGMPNKAVDYSRTVKVQFDSSRNAYLPWKFYPLVKSIELHPGETKRIAYFAENDSGHTMTVQAIPSVAPSEAALYLKKTECFCFTQQTLKNREGLDMPMIFHIDPNLPKYIKTITLSYTLFDASGFKPKKVEDRGKIN